MNSRVSNPNSITKFCSSNVKFTSLLFDSFQLFCFSEFNYYSLVFYFYFMNKRVNASIIYYMLYRLRQIVKERKPKKNKITANRGSFIFEAVFIIKILNKIFFYFLFIIEKCTWRLFSKIEFIKMYNNEVL